jgi:hypothetical protein
LRKRAGRIKNWVPAKGGGIGGDKINVWPDYVLYSHKVSGSSQGSAVVTARLEPEDGSWRIAELAIQP